MSSSDDGENQPLDGQLKTLFLALHISGGQVGLPILIITFALSKSVHRHPTLVNLWASWVIYSLSYSLLLYSGQDGLSSPSTMLCRVQSTMVHGVAPMASSAGLMVVYQIWNTFREPFQRQTLPNSSNRWSNNLRISLAIPYVVFFAFVLSSAILGHRYPNKVYASSSGLYCTLHDSSFARYGIPVFCSTILAFVVLLEAVIVVRFYRMWSQISRVFPLASRKTSPSLILRILLFSLYSIVAFCTALAFLFDLHILYAWPYMVQASVPLVAVLVFGTQKDMFRVWCFWRGGDSPHFHMTTNTPSPSVGTSNLDLISGSRSTLSIPGTLSANGIV